MAKTIKVRWQVEDGYAGGARPQSTTLNLEDFEGCSDEQIVEMIEQCIQDDFEQSISWGADIPKAVAAIKKALEEE